MKAVFNFICKEKQWFLSGLGLYIASIATESVKSVFNNTSNRMIHLIIILSVALFLCLLSNHIFRLIKDTDRDKYKLVNLSATIVLFVAVFYFFIPIVRDF